MEIKQELSNKGFDPKQHRETTSAGTATLIFDFLLYL